MEGHFKFGHTIQPKEMEENSQSEEDLGALFKIGNDKIKIQLQRQQIEDSDETPRQGQSKKERKRSKEKKKKDKKHKKHRHKSQSEQSQDVEVEHIKKDDKKKSTLQYQNTQLVVYNQQLNKQQISLLQKSGTVRNIQKQLKGSSNIELKIKLGDGLLNVDVLDFPQRDLFKYGLMQKHVPQYNRINQLQILGLEANNQKKIIKKLNKIINQKNQNPNRDEVAKQRYYNFQGFENIDSQKAPSIRHDRVLSQFIALSTQTFTQSKEEQLLMKTNKEYNCKLKEEPNNITLWLEFAQVQAKCMAVGSSISKTKQAVLERQLSILQKALQINAGQQRLACRYLQLLLQKQADSSFSIQKCVEFIKNKPHCLQLWSAYIKLKLGEFSLYSHQIARKVCEQLLKMLKGMIDSARSAVNMWKLRKVNLQIIKSICRLYRLEGYGQLATAIIVALLEFNWFLPQHTANISNLEQRIKMFGQLWQDHNHFRLGEIVTSNSPQNQEQNKANKYKFIGQLSRPQSNCTHNYQKQLLLHQNIWRPSHPIRDHGLINKRPESYILIQDIDFTLSNYRDNDSLNGFIDLLADHLGLPTVFTVQNLHSEFTLLLIEKKINQKTTHPFNIFASCDNFWWARFWNPANTELTFTPAKFLKIEYFKRILRQIKPKLQATKDINVYLMFLSCCYYVYPKLRQSLQIQQHSVLKQIQSLLGEEPLNAKLWSIYIHSSFMLKQNPSQCIQCWLQLFQSNRLIHGGNGDTKINEEIYFWFWQFLKHAPLYTSWALKMKLMLFDERQIQKANIGEPINQREKMRLQKYLMEKASFVLAKGDNKQVQIQIEDIYLLLFILDASKYLGFPNLILLNKSILQFIIQYASRQKNCSDTQYFSVHSLINRKSISTDSLEQSPNLYCLQYLQVIKYWAQNDHSSLLNFAVDFQLFQNKSLTLWIALCTFKWQKYTNKFNFHQFFYRKAKQLAEQTYIQDTSYLIMLNRLLLSDTAQTHEHFALSSLKKCPYSKQLYLINLILTQDSRDRDRIKALMHQKGIRILDQDLFQ